MSNTQTNSDALFKQKFENFAPLPPDQVWGGIKAGIVVQPSFFALYWKSIAAAIVILAIVSAGIWYYSSDDSENINQPLISETDSLQNVDGEISNNNADANINDVDKLAIEQTELEVNNEMNLTNESETINPKNNNTAPDESPTIVNTQSDKQIARKEAGYDSSRQKKIKSTNGNNVIVVRQQDNPDRNDIDLNASDNIKYSEISALAISDIDKKDLSQYSGSNATDIEATLSEGLIESGIQDFVFKESKWSIGFYFSPEMMLNNFDSIEMLTNYSFGIEPTYLINKHLFLRFGIGASYSRDRGFAKLDYSSNDLLGSYEYVYDVTFDSIDGQVLPTYHTTTAEVWDTVRHLEINTITNDYIYLQAPVLFGYYNSKSKFNWYFYGGPAINFMVSKQIEEPLKEINAIDINNLQNDLPERSPYYFQLWLGAGIEYKAGKNLGISLEPNYRYYFKNVFKTTPYSKSGLSGLSLRLGLVYTIQ